MIAAPRLIVAADAPFLAQGHAASFPDDPWDAGAFAALMEQGWGFLTQDGFILARCAGEDAEILTFAVFPDARRRGAGRMLLDALRDEAIRRGAERLILDVAADNTPARALYAAAGFQELARRRGYYARAGERVDALLLSLSLRAG